jgi:hypothetical protein
MTSSCRNCGRYVHLEPVTKTLFRAYDFESDRYTPSTTLHACGESDRALMRRQP